MLDKRRKGIFRVSKEVIESKPNVVMEILSRCIVVRAESLMIDDVIEYYAYSKEFDIVEQGNQVPRYAVAYKDNEIAFVKEN